MEHCEPGCACCNTTATEAEIQVTINPEARVIAERAGYPLGRLRVDEWCPMRIAIVNEGFVTGPLAMTVDPVLGVELQTCEIRLTGAREQLAQFQVRSAEPRLADLTLRFWALGSLGGLANKNTVHLLLEYEDDAPANLAPPPALAAGANGAMGTRGATVPAE